MIISQIADSIARLLQEHPECRLVFIRYGDLNIAEFPELQHLADRIEWMPKVSFAELPFELVYIDINLIPLASENTFSNAKNELQYFQAALVGVPIVISSTPTSSVIIRDKENGFLVQSLVECYAKLKYVMINPQLRRSVANNAFFHVLQAYGPERQVQVMHALVEQIYYGGLRSAQAFEVELMRRNRTYSLPPVPEFKILFEHDMLKLSPVIIVIPLYNYAQYVITALDLVKAQTTLADLDLIVVDDVSTDNSLTVVQTLLKTNIARFNRVMLVQNHIFRSCCSAECCFYTSRNTISFAT